MLHPVVTQLRDLAAEYGAQRFDVALVDEQSQTVMGSFTIADIERSLDLFQDYQRRGYELYVSPLEEGISSDVPDKFFPLVLKAQAPKRCSAQERYAHELAWIKEHYQTRFDPDKADWAIVKKLAVEGYEKEAVKGAVLELSPELVARKSSQAEYYVNRTVERAWSTVQLEMEQGVVLENGQELYVQ